MSRWRIKKTAERRKQKKTSGNQKRVAYVRLSLLAYAALSVNIHMLAYEQAPRQPYSCFRSDRHLGALSATYKNTHL